MEMEGQITVLLIEDDSEIVESVAVILQLRWPEANLLSTMRGEKGVELAQNESPDIIILDLGLPDIDGFQVLRKIRTFSDVPVVILTVMGEEMNKVRGLELGADDYIVKPFSPAEFLARVRAALRRGEVLQERQYHYTDEKSFIRGKLRIDFVSHEVSIGDNLLKLSPSQYEILHELVNNENEVVSQETMLDKIKGLNPAYLDVSVKRLQERLELELGYSILNVEEGGKGYKFG